VKKGEGVPAELIEQSRLDFNEIFNLNLPLKTDAGELFEEMVKMVKQVRGKAKEKAENYISYPFRVNYHVFQTLLEELEEVRDPRRFFESVGAKKNDLKLASDACKQLDTFIDRALPEYQLIKQYLSDNHENLANLPDGNGEKLIWMDTFFRSADPSVDFRTARKTYDELKTALNELMKHFRAEVETVYVNVFNALQAEIAKYKVPGAVIGDRDATIENLKRQKSIASLKLAISNADHFRSGEIAKIIKVSEAEKVPEPGRVVQEPSAKYKPGKAGSFHVISNETEMEEYLKALRQDMLKILKEKKKIILE
jgi:hypothetical protein